MPRRRIGNLAAGAVQVDEGEDSGAVFRFTGGQVAF
jgi:hypothetical protein